MRDLSGRAYQSRLPLSFLHWPAPVWGDGSEPVGSRHVHVNSVNNVLSCSIPVLVIGPSACGPLPVVKQSQVGVGHAVFPLAPVDHVSPLILSKFQVELVNHPDRSAVAYVLSG